MQRNWTFCEEKRDGLTSPKIIVLLVLLVSPTEELAVSGEEGVTVELTKAQCSCGRAQTTVSYSGLLSPSRNSKGFGQLGIATSGPENLC